MRQDRLLRLLSQYAFELTLVSGEKEFPTNLPSHRIYNQTNFS